MLKEEISGNIIALLTVTIWGVTFISTRILLRALSPVEILVLRFTLAYLCLCLVPTPKIPIISFKIETLFAFGGLTGISLYFLFENIALVYTSVSNVAIIVSTTPFFTAILACFFLQAPKLGIYYYLGFVLAISGIFLITKQGSQMEWNLQGDGLALLASLSWAVYTIFVRKLSAYAYNSLSITKRLFFYGLIFMIPLMFMENFHLSLNILLTPVNIINLLFLGLGASALCFATWTYALKKLGAARASAYIYLVPVITIFCAVLILDEAITFYTLIGSALTIFGLVLSEYKGNGSKKMELKTK